MKVFVKFIFFSLGAIALLAPFTFLKPIFNKPLPVVIVEPEKPLPVKPPEKPMHSVNLPDFSAIGNTQLKKQRFFNFLKPTIINANNRLLALRNSVVAIEEKLGIDTPLSPDEIVFLNTQTKIFRIKGDLTYFQQVHQLLNRIDIIPTELILVQAANESAWGTSRFARIGLNFFGLWCYKKGCGMIPNSRISGGKHEVAAFQSLEEAVDKYLYNINTHYAYEVFRSIRQQLREQEQPLSPQILATGLLPYSERGVDYVSEIINMLRHNAKYIKE